MATRRAGVTIEESIRTAVKEGVREAVSQLRGMLTSGTDDLQSVPKAARAVGLHPSTVREQYLARLTKYGSGRKVRISVAELRQLMRVEASGEEVDLDARADALEKKGRRR